ncbi:hypothetical protein ACFQ6N_17415 [Kitasatospora sp. NPDC056446]|uniref:hypothetical protein n=1 Tax=Kitasatospora sp. NPDC056446 TaxID=3345819 RepID=UPI0036860121
MLRARERALKASTLPRTDSTIEASLAIVRDLARFLTGTRNKQEWALTDLHDVEAFLATMPKARQRRLTVLRHYFRFARSRKVVLIDTTRGVKAKGPSGFSGTSVAVGQQRQPFRHWTTGADAHPHEALLGVLALLHAASSSEVRLLRVDDLASRARAGRGQAPPARHRDQVVPSADRPECGEGEAPGAGLGKASRGRRRASGREMAIRIHIAAVRHHHQGPRLPPAPSST